MLPVLILLVVGLGIVEPSILQPTNVVNVFSQSAVVCVRPWTPAPFSTSTLAASAVSWPGSSGT